MEGKIIYHSLRGIRIFNPDKFYKIIIVVSDFFVIANYEVIGGANRSEAIRRGIN
jgi:hypothetical protein